MMSCCDAVSNCPLTSNSECAGCAEVLWMCVLTDCKVGGIARMICFAASMVEENLLAS